MAHPFIEWPADAAFAGLFSRLSPAEIIRVAGRHFELDPAASQCLLLESMYDPGRQLRLAVAIGTPDMTPARAWPDGQVFALRYPLRTTMSRRGCEVMFGEHACELYRFPNDRRLRGMRRFAGRESAAETWQAWLDDADDGLKILPQSLRRTLLRYVPEQKWIVRLGARAQDAAGETHKIAVAVRAADVEDIAALHARLHDLRAAAPRQADGFRMPKPIAFDEQLGLMAVRWVWGDDLLDLLKSADAAEVLGRVAKGLHALHRTELPSARPLGARDRLIQLQHAVRDLQCASPQLQSDLAALLGDMERAHEKICAPEHDTVHNDFHFKQLRGRADKLTLLDFERCVRGDGLFDVATFAAQLDMLGHRPQLGVSESTAAAWSRDFLRAWEQVSAERIAMERFGWYGACALLTLARGQLRHLRSGWPDVVQRCLEQANACMRRGSTQTCS